MKAVLSNRIYLESDLNLRFIINEELTYIIPPRFQGDFPEVIRNMSIVNDRVISLPIGRTDLIPDGYEIKDNRVYVPVTFPERKLTLRKSQQDVYDLVSDNYLLNAKVGWGKAQPSGSKVRVPNGWINIEDIQIGDTIVTPEGTPAKVINKFFHENKPIYKFTFADGRTVEACEDHLWYTVNANKVNKVLSTKEILNSNYYKRKKLYIPLCSAIEDINTNNLPIHPYLLGVILGDGCISHNQIVVSSKDEHILNRVRELLPPNHYIKFVPNTNCAYRITSDIGKPNILLNKLRDLGLQGTKSNSKFIPEEYIYTSLENKLQLLQGLIDTDGYVDKDNKIEYYTVSKALAETFASIIYSLGGQCSIGVKKPTYTYKGELKSGQDCYVLRPQRLPYDLKRKLVSLPRKLELIRNGQYDNSNTLRINDIEYVGNKDCWCISIDSANKLYLTNNYIVTHNTFTGLAIAGKLSQKTLVVVHNQVLRDQWVEETQNMYGFTPDIIGGGKFGTSTPIVIGNIQSLSKNPTKVQNLFGTLIVDEVHHAPASTFSTLIDNNRARYKIGLSGTLERKDEKHVVIKDYFSKSVISPPAENTEKPEVHVIESDIPFPINVSSWAQANNILCNNPNYIELIVFLADYYAEQGHKVLVVGNRVEFLKQCSEYFNPEEVALCIGETPTEIKNNLKAVMETKKILFASQQLFSEGMSVNSLSCLIMAAPLNNQPLLEQLIGRVIRKSDNKKSPVVVDIKLQGGTTYNQYNKRLGHYIDQSYKISYFRKNSL